MGHYNSTHAVLEEEKHVFEIALLQVRNVKQSAYFRWQWEPELFLANPTQLTSNEGKRNLCSKVFAVSCVRHLSILMKRPLTACVLQRAALKSPVVTTECKFSRFAFRTYFPAAAFALPQMTQWAIAGSASFQRASQAHKTTAPLKHHKQKQYSSNEMVSQLCIISLKAMQTVVWYILLQVPTTPHRRGQNLIVSIT